MRLHIKSRAISLLTLAFALAWPAKGVAQPGPIDPVEPAWTLAPDHVGADSAFALSVLSYKFTCATAFSHQSVDVQAGKLYLSFTAEERKGIMCPMIYKPYGPTFKVPPLKAGNYEVWVANQPACVYAQPACLIKIAPELAGTLVVGDVPGQMTYLISPKQAEPGRDFDLSLLSYQWTCGTTFSNTSATVDGNTITVSFLPKTDPAAICPAIYKPYGFSVPVKGLRAGTYKVLAQRQPGCMGCMPIAPQFVDTLSVQPAAKDGWFIKPKEVAAGTPFELDLLNNAYGNCQTSFANQSLSVANGQIVATFSVESHPERVCVTDIRPFGPAFKVEALKPGRYPVLAAVRPACLFAVPACKIAEMPPVVVDTLTVAGVVDPQPEGWFADPSMFKANTPFTLNLRNYKYGSCGTEFTDPVLTIDGNTITASFGVVLHPEIKCIWNQVPYGPSFEVAGLKEGRYTLVVKETVSDCPPGMVCINPPKKTLSQALEFNIGSTSALAAAPAARPSFRTDREGVAFSLPEAGNKPVRAEVYAPDGRRLQSRSVPAAGSAERFLDLGRDLKPGLYLLKLTVPGAKASLHPFLWQGAGR
jgi:hypothetical protein